ncbi:DUF6538 domain-containing protein [Enterobacter sp. V87_3]|uniref:DUF6538 domain-containing protein n=1 Tax=Enterobacter sp. V87_3 TaxID=3044236 RepID=UPI0032B8556E
MIIVSIKGQAYLFQRKDGIWMFQIFVPKYLRFLYPCRMWRKTTSTRNLNEARRFRNHLLLEWEELKRKYNPSNPDQWLQQSIGAISAPFPPAHGYLGGVAVRMGYVIFCPVQHLTQSRSDKPPAPILYHHLTKISASLTISHFVTKRSFT